MAFSPQFRKTKNMSVVALPRFDSLYGKDPSVVESFSDPEDESPHPTETVFQGIADPILAFGRVIFNNSLDPLSSMGAMPCLLPLNAPCIGVFKLSTLPFRMASSTRLFLGPGQIARPRIRLTFTCDLAIPQTLEEKSRQIATMSAQ